MGVKQSSATAIKPKGFNFDFTVETNERFFILFAATLEEKRKWIQAIAKIVTHRKRHELIKKL